MVTYWQKHHRHHSWIFFKRRVADLEHQVGWKRYLFEAIYELVSWKSYVLVQTTKWYYLARECQSTKHTALVLVQTVSRSVREPIQKSLRPGITSWHFCPQTTKDNKKKQFFKWRDEGVDHWSGGTTACGKSSHGIVACPSEEEKHTNSQLLEAEKMYV